MAAGMGLVIPLIKLDFSLRVKRCKYAKSKPVCLVGTTLLPAVVPSPSLLQKHVKELGWREGWLSANKEMLDLLGETLTDAGTEPTKLVTGIIRGIAGGKK